VFSFQHFLVAVTLVEISSTCKDFREIKFKNFQGPDLFSRTFQAWKMENKFKDSSTSGYPVPDLHN